jgi:hypothetical protein
MYINKPNLFRDPIGLLQIEKAVGKPIHANELKNNVSS